MEFSFTSKVIFDEHERKTMNRNESGNTTNVEEKSFHPSNQ